MKKTGILTSTRKEEMEGQGSRDLQEGEFEEFETIDVVTCFPELETES